MDPRDQHDVLADVRTVDHHRRELQVVAKRASNSASCLSLASMNRRCGRRRRVRPPSLETIATIRGTPVASNATTCVAFGENSCRGAPGIARVLDDRDSALRDDRFHSGYRKPEAPPMSAGPHLWSDDTRKALEEAGWFVGRNVSPRCQFARPWDHLVARGWDRGSM